MNIPSLQPERLSNLSGSELAEVALEQKSNVALFEKLLLACVNKQQKAEFINHVSWFFLSKAFLCYKMLYY